MSVDEHHDHAHEFRCPNDGLLDRDDVIFLCNTCEGTEVKQIEGMYMCTTCFTSVHPFQCRICDSKEVALSAPLHEDQAA